MNESNIKLEDKESLEYSDNRCVCKCVVYVNLK